MPFVKRHRKYYKYYRDWSQPTDMTSNGTMGGSSFATNQSSSHESRNFYRIFSEVGGGWHSAKGLPQWVSWYNPNPLKVTKLSFLGASAGNIGDGIIQACDDNSSWIDIFSFSNTNETGDFEIDLSSNESAYKYWRIYITSCYYYNGGYYPLISGMTITAQEKFTTETTKEQADYYIDNNKLYSLATKKRTYYKYEYQDWTQPVATAATTAITGGNMVITASSTESSRKVYGALDGDVSTWSNAWLSSSSGAAWWQVKFPYKIKITGLTHYNPYVSASCAITSAQFFTSSSKTTPIGNSFSTPDTDWYKTVISGIPSEGIITDTIYFSGVGGGYAGIGELVITAQKQLSAVETTEEEAEWYVDKLTAYTPAVKGLLTYRIYEKQRDTGTYTFTLYEDYEGKLLFVGNGGPGNSSQADSQWWYSGGGSGACFEGIVRLPADTYTLTIGTLGYGNNVDNTHYNSNGVASTASYLTNSAGQELIRVGAGAKGNTNYSSTTGGAGGVLTLGTLDVVETIKAVNGNKGGSGSTSANYASSAYDGTATGYGAGTGAERYQGNVYGIAGIFKLEIEYQAEGIRSY